MSDKFYALSVNTYVFLSNLVDYVKKLEHGDSDSSGSTLRTMGIVILIVAVVALIGAAVMLAAHFIANSINNTTFKFS